LELQFHYHCCELLMLLRPRAQALQAYDRERCRKMNKIGCSVTRERQRNRYCGSCAYIYD